MYKITTFSTPAKENGSPTACAHKKEARLLVCKMGILMDMHWVFSLLMLKTERVCIEQSRQSKGPSKPWNQKEASSLRRSGKYTLAAAIQYASRWSTAKDWGIWRSKAFHKSLEVSVQLGSRFLDGVFGSVCWGPHHLRNTKLTISTTTKGEMWQAWSGSKMKLKMNSGAYASLVQESHKLDHAVAAEIERVRRSEMNDILWRVWLSNERGGKKKKKKGS